MADDIKKTYDSIHYFKDINPRSYQLLGYLGYNKESVFDTPYGNWTVYVKKNFSFPYFNAGFSSPVNKFAAVYRGTGKNMFAYGSFEKDLEEIKQNLLVLSRLMLYPVQKFLGIPRTLTEENAQDYGYIRGVIFGILLIMGDFVYSWTFKLQEGILTGFIEYIKRVYDGNPSLGNFIGIAWTGMYFGFPLILMPILYGNFCVKRAEKSRQKKLKRIEQMFSGYEFGINAENALDEEFTTIIEEKRKQSIYNEISAKTQKLSKEDFETFYIRIQQGFLSPEALHDFVTELKELTGEELTFDKFVEIVARYYRADLVTDLGIKPLS